MYWLWSGTSPRRQSTGSYHLPLCSLGQGTAGCMNNTTLESFCCNGSVRWSIPSPVGPIEHESKYNNHNTVKPRELELIGTDYNVPRTTQNSE